MHMSDKEEQHAFRITDRRGQPKDEPAKPEPQPEPARQAPPRDASKRRAPTSIDFSNFVLSLSTSALMHMGYIEDPQTRKAAKNLEMAKQEVDIIEMLETKTHGNLSAEEAKLMEEVLYELRLRFVEASKQP
jgi:hypothetical protein